MTPASEEPLIDSLAQAKIVLGALGFASIRPKQLVRDMQIWHGKRALRQAGDRLIDMAAIAASG